MNIFKLFLFLFLMGFINPSFSQETDAKTDSKTETKGKPKKETKIIETVLLDSISASELLKRAVNWVKLEVPRYEKLNGVTTSAKAECIASFAAKPKELNPPCDYTGTYTMKVVIECKDSRYRYTISNIRHKSKTGKTTGGSIDNIVPECGSMIMSDVQWKKIKGEAKKCANTIITELKEAMFLDSAGYGDDW